MWIWIAGAALVVVALAGYAVYLNLALKKRHRQRATWRREVEQMVQQRTDKIINSIAVIACAMLENQMSLSECCIRLSALLNQLGPMAEDARFQPVHKAAEELSHIPILEEWRQLTFRQQMKFMKEMEVIENKYGDFILDTCRSLQQSGLREPPQGGVGHYSPGKH